MKCKSRVIINSEQCKGCALCIAACPQRCLVISSKINKAGYRFVEWQTDNACTGCGMCYQMCPDVCIEIHSSD